MCKKQYLIVYCLFLLLPIGCISEFNAKLSESEGEVIVVEGDVLENSNVDIIITKVMPLINPDFEMSDLYVPATVHVVGDNGYKSEKAQYTGNGIHRVWVGELSDDVQYGIEIEYNGNTYRSIPEKPLITPEIDNISWAQPLQGEDVSIRVSTSESSQDVRFFSWEYIEDWEYTAKFQYHDNDYYCWKNMKGKEIMVGSTESLKENKLVNHPLLSYEANNLRFSVLYRILIKQIAISKKSYEYALIRAKMSEDMGGLFSPQPAEPIGNVICETDLSKKVIGYINIVKNITEKELYIEGKDISKKNIEDISCVTVLNPEVTDEPYNYVPYDEVFIHKGCIDCTFWGGTTDKPHFWPTDH